jgi:hypothetical protein
VTLIFELGEGIMLTKHLIAFSVFIFLIIFSSLLFAGMQYSLYTENSDNLQSGKSPDQISDISKEKLDIKFSASVDTCQDIIRDFRDRIEEIKWMDKTTLVVKAYVISTCQNKIENIGYEFINDKIILQFQEVGESMANCLCSHNITYTFTNLEKKEYKFELIRLK